MASSPSPDAGWIDRDEYPFDPRYADLDRGRLHYVDEGSGHPVVFLHGNPTWSFLFREPIRELADDYRCIAPDYLGFGLSEAPRNWSYYPEAHAEVVGEFLGRLDATEPTLVVHDWGGPIGIDYAIDNPISGLAVVNTFAWPVEDRWVRTFSALVGGPVGRLLCERYNLFARAVMPLAFADRSRLSPRIHEHYLRPPATPADRKGTWVFPRRLVGSRDWLARLWDARDVIAGAPALLCWELRDPLFRRDYLRRWQALFPDADTVAFGDAGHYVPEEKGEALTAELRAFLARIV